MSTYSDFPDSSKKAPNVFIGAIDYTGAPTLAASVVKAGPTVINPTPTPTPPPPPTIYEYYTTVLYPYLLPNDNVTSSGVSITGGFLTTNISIIGDTVTSTGVDITSGELIESFRYKTYNDGIPDTVASSGINITDGSLTVVIEYITYSRQIDTLRSTGVSITNGSLS